MLIIGLVFGSELNGSGDGIGVVEDFGRVFTRGKKRAVIEEESRNGRCRLIVRERAIMVSPRSYHAGTIKWALGQKISESPCRQNLILIL